ncbi:hypothetical protein BDL97_17G045300 [Sphagnum fallax]|nr:hypothetical protein BDL97_17G045300 [Sphagnum fallax]
MCDVFQGILEAIKLETGMSMNASDPRSKAASLATCTTSPGYFDNDYLGGMFRLQHSTLQFKFCHILRLNKHTTYIVCLHKI